MSYFHILFSPSVKISPLESSGYIFVDGKIERVSDELTYDFYIHQFYSMVEKSVIYSAVNMNANYKSRFILFFKLDLIRRKN